MDETDQTDGELSFDPPTGALRVGVDLVTIEEVEESVRAHGDRYLRRVYTEREVDDCRHPVTGRPDAGRLAGRFATKEAAVKALRVLTGPYRDIEVTTGADGAPGVRFHGAAARAAIAAGVRECAVSISHDHGRALATVVLVGSSWPPSGNDSRTEEAG